MRSTRMALAARSFSHAPWRRGWSYRRGSLAGEQCAPRMAFTCTAPKAGPQAFEVDHSRDAFIVSVARTPNGCFRGKLADFSAPDLGAIAIRAAMHRANFDPALIDEAFFGNVLSANCGQAPARRAILSAGLPASVVCTTVNKVCSSGLKSVMFGVNSLNLGYADAVVVGGMESMTNAPYYVKKPKDKMTKEQIIQSLEPGGLVDGMVMDGLWDPYGAYLMGNIAENLARRMNITREEQDNHATRSYSSAARAQSLGNFANELVPVYPKDSTAVDGSVNFAENCEALLSSDEEISNFLRVDRLPKLNPAFEENGTITAGNSSKISDGAAALILASGAFVKRHNLKPIARVLSQADVELPPAEYPLAPARVIPVALQRARMDAKDVDYYEINEAFSAVSIIVNRMLDLNPAHVNLFGGSVATGHPIGASGARILVTLTSVLRQTSGTIGVAAVCNGGGGGSALVIERMS
ncbi:putative acetyl-CoA acetyltransferase, cytosolic 2 [Porphyridium purpureum]|uniref:acetyl-CoA C-acetyltransferase n=1 Tax=Porphyridium purpureum TaxID=35688 RepID=A0A5J4Z6S9_PORPP|nr:putative acetyl-CoA acetyltransferase, cytosolic 2 [Porphyridium purpureum]|eukprot:POR9340..scf295_1